MVRLYTIQRPGPNMAAPDMWRTEVEPGIPIHSLQDDPLFITSFSQLINTPAIAAALSERATSLPARREPLDAKCIGFHCGYWKSDVDIARRRGCQKWGLA